MYMYILEIVNFFLTHGLFEVANLAESMTDGRETILSV